MSKPCRLTFFAYMLSEVQANGAYDRDDLENGIDYAEGLIAMGYSHEPHDMFDLQGYINWVKAELEDYDKWFRLVVAKTSEDKGGE